MLYIIVGQCFAAIGNCDFAGPGGRTGEKLELKNAYCAGRQQPRCGRLDNYRPYYWPEKYCGRHGPSALAKRFFPSLGNHDYYLRNTLILQWPFLNWGASVTHWHDHCYERLLVNKPPYFVNVLGGRNIYGKSSQNILGS